LDFLLSKASEYSNFISNDLDELQASMAEDARRALAKADKKKRKAEKKAGSSKKLKTSEGSKKLETAQAVDSEKRKERKAIFVQPPNLAEDCFLKDYQLEGVRWLASLYENGVSGMYVNR
jgi:ATP-dependent DNA helicase